VSVKPVVISARLVWMVDRLPAVIPAMPEASWKLLEMMPRAAMSV